MNPHVKAAEQLFRSGQVEAAEQACRESLALWPQDAQTLHLLGVVLHRRGQVDAAIAALTEAVKVAPALPHPRIALAGMLGELGQHADALEQLQIAVKIDDRIPDLHNNLGTALQSLGQTDAAIEAYRRAIQLRPSLTEAHINLGNSLRRMQRSGEAALAYDAAAKLRPDSAAIYKGLAECHLARAEIAEGISIYERAVALQPNSPELFSAWLYTLHYDANQSPSKLAAAHRDYARRFSTRSAGLREPLTRRTSSGPMRVGFFSPDFREHTPPRFITAAFAYHDPNHFELFCYSDVREPDLVTERLRRMVEHWRVIAGMNDDDAERIIRSDQLDVLVDLRGHGPGNRLRLFGRKLAPIQTTMVGYFDTTGLSTMDYRVTDALQDPPGESDTLHAEKLLRLTPSCWCYWPDDDAPPVAPLPALSAGIITFGSLNKVAKISDVCARLWSAILAAVPDSRLLLAMPGGEMEATTLRARLGAAGIEQRRIEVMSSATSRKEYLERFARIDIALDTFPFNGITTTCDALWMGVPAVSLYGSTTVSRAGRSILTAAGFENLAAGTQQDCAQIAQRLASDRFSLSGLRAGTRARLSAMPLLDHRCFASKLYASFRAVCNRETLPE